MKAYQCDRCGKFFSHLKKDTKENNNIQTESTTKWIPVSERLPEEPFMYLVSIINRLGYQQMEVDGFIHGKWERFGDDVKAWMPLPQPYKMEEEKDEN